VRTISRIPNFRESPPRPPTCLDPTTYKDQGVIGDVDPHWRGTPAFIRDSSVARRRARRRGRPAGGGPAAPAGAGHGPARRGGRAGGAGPGGGGGRGGGAAAGPAGGGGAPGARAGLARPFQPTSVPAHRRNRGEVVTLSTLTNLLSCLVICLQASTDPLPPPWFSRTLPCLRSPTAQALDVEAGWQTDRRSGLRAP